ncbi:unnamed protein product [Rotaria sp. Silwood1]|nr:unnamed protein product [Rotaria sp. Silwood1]CAF4687556.1 unnamed protein product [Rotaria sp. Silwood1]
MGQTTGNLGQHLGEDAAKILSESMSKLAKNMCDIAQSNHSRNIKWQQIGVTIAGGHGKGNALNQLNDPHGLFVNNDQSVYIADFRNHRIVEWRNGTNSGQVVAGGKGEGNKMDQLKYATDVVFDKETDSLIVCDRHNRRVMRWPRGKRKPETILTNIACYGLTMDDQKFLYVSDIENHSVKKYRLGETKGTIVAGGNGKGNGLNQLNLPIYLYVDRDQSVYISDTHNHRVMKWMKDAKEGIVVAGGRNQGDKPTQLSLPQGIFVDHLSTVYVADGGNHRVMRWHKGATQGDMIVGGNGAGAGPNQLNCPGGLSLDQHENIYVVDYNNHRVQRFSIEATN